MNYINECKDVEVDSIIKKKYLDPEIPEFAYKDAGLHSEVVYGRKDIVNVKNNNLGLKYDVWAKYINYDIFNYKKHGIIEGKYRPKITNIFKEGEKVKITIDSNEYTGIIIKNKFGNLLNPCYIKSDNNIVECLYETIEKIYN